MKPTKDSYTATEVGTLIESFRSEFRTFGESLSDVRERVVRLEELFPRIESIERDVGAIKIILRPFASQLSDHERRIVSLEKSR